MICYSASVLISPGWQICLSMIAPACYRNGSMKTRIVHSDPCEPAHRHHVALGLRLGVAIGPHSWDAPGLADGCRARPEDHRHFYARRSPVHTEILVGPIDGSSGPSLAGTSARMDAGDADLCRARLGGHGVDWPGPASGNTRGCWLSWWPFSLPHSTSSSTPIGPMCSYVLNGASAPHCG